MHPRVTRSALVIGAGLLSIGAYHLAAQASSPESHDMQDLVSSLGDFPASYAKGGGAPHELGRLKLLQRTMHFVDEKYVDPARIEPDAMFDSALDRVERQVSEVLFQRSEDGELLHISVGSYTTTIELPPIESTSDLQDQLGRVAQVLDEHLSDQVEPAEVEYALINGVLGTLDPHSILLPPAAAEEMDTDNSGEFGGLGITITVVEGVLTVEYPLEDTPAWDAGLQASDRIVRINGESTVNMDLQEAVSRLRGKVGSVVTITVERESWDAPRDIDIERATIKLHPVKGTLLDDDIAYIRISNFHAAVSGDMRDQLAAFNKASKGGEIKGLVLDLRGNPGGYLHQAIEVSDLFLSQGTIVSTVEREGSKVDETTARNGTTVGDFPIVVLVNAGSASASEIVAGALKNQGRAAIVGERTFGKGSVQHLYPNEADGSKLKLTVARYLTPGDKSIQAVGIPPDIALDQTVFYEMTDDEQVHTLVSMFGSDRSLREADLDHSLGTGEVRKDAPVHSMRWLHELDSETKRPRSDTLDVSDDWEVQFARELLLASPDQANRAEVLSSVEAVVETHRAQEQLRIIAAFSKLGVDWEQGEQPEQISLGAELDLGDDGLLLAGPENKEVVWLRATNQGSEPLHQVLAVCESGIRELDNREYYFGKLDPGETRSFPALIALDEGYRDEAGVVSCTWQDASGAELSTTEHQVRTQGQALPEFQWSYSVVDGGTPETRGDQDGVVEQGELVALKVTLTNTGQGAASGAFVKVKNRAGKAVDLQQGSFEIGEIAPGESAEALIIFQVGLSPAELPMEIIVGDQQRFDHAVVWRAGFQETFAQHEDLLIPVGQAPEWEQRLPPVLEITRSPGLTESQSAVVLSGVARDDTSLREVIIYHLTEDETDKVFYQGGQEGVTALPWTVDARLEPGMNLFVVLTRDEMGLSDTASVSVWYEEDAAALAE